MAFQHVHTESKAAAATGWLSPSLMSFLNNKSNLPVLADESYIPERILLTAQESVNWLARNPGPWVLKAATDYSNGGGYGVAFCWDQKAGMATDVLDLIKSCDLLVIERKLAIKTNWCFHFSVDSKVKVSLIGVTEQVVTPGGRFLGGWLGEAVPKPPLDLVVACTRLVERAAGMGFRGCCGVDAALLCSGETKIFDLNFRINGTTPALLAFGALEFSCGMWRSWNLEMTLKEAAHSILSAVQSRRFLPIAIYDPAATDNGPGNVQISGIVLGGDRKAVAEAAKKYETGFC
ncbi:hypothetical protein [Amycolatopsis sp. NPDC049868]|uniref:hypothetical protein n=1 Tax=Amycolatopsis sp. NPDC049868 TaxID=3363934 RepID=UPI0037A8F127